MLAKRVVVPVRVFREAVARKVEATSLRYVAAEIGISRSALYTFIQNEKAEPYSKNYQKFLAWYVRDRREAQGIDADSAAASLELLTLHFPPRRRRRIQQDLLELLEQRRGDEMPAPQWLNEIRHR